MCAGCNTPPMVEAAVDMVAHVFLALAGALFTAGIFLFSGSLYALAITGISWLGAITPLCGVAFIGGWLCLGVAAWKM